jgi:hypothetical protein
MHHDALRLLRQADALRLNVAIPYDWGDAVGTIAAMMRPGAMATRHGQKLSLVQRVSPVI